MTISYEQAKLELDVARELTFASDVLADILPNDAGAQTPPAIALVNYIKNHGSFRPRVGNLPVEVELLRRAKGGNELAFYRIMFAYAEALRGFIKEARRVGGITWEEVVETAIMALAACIEAYDPSKGTPLASIIGLYGDNEVRDMQNPAARVVGRPVGQRELNRYYAIMAEGAERYAAEHGHISQTYADTYPYALRVAAERVAAKGSRHELTVATFNAIYLSFRADVRLDATVTSNSFNGDGDECTYLDIAAPREQPTGFATETDADIKADAERALSVLDEKELEVVLLAYGFPPASYRPLKDPAIAEELKATRGYSKSTVQRIRKRALAKMRAELGVEGVED